MNLRHAYEDYSPAILRITVKTPAGDLQTGTAFHIGNGLIVTARHVLEGYELESMTNEYQCHTDKITVKATHFHDNEKIDLAVMETSLNLENYLTKVIFHDDDRRNKAKTDRIPLGGHLDDWIGEEFILSRVLVMGYPIIPFWIEVGLVSVIGEINAVIDRYDVPHSHFLLSPMARGGFSGGPAISEWGFLLGVITHSLTDNGKVTELGHAVAVSIEPLLQLLAQKDLRPPGFDDEFWNLLKD